MRHVALWQSFEVAEQIAAALMPVLEAAFEAVKEDVVILLLSLRLRGPLFTRQHYFARAGLAYSNRYLQFIRETGLHCLRLEQP